MNLDSLVELVRALAKKCDECEYEQRMHKYYEEQYRKERAKTDTLRDQLRGVGASPDA
jgi:hypothetical protein